MTTTPSGLRVKPGDPVASSTLRSRMTGTTRSRSTTPGPLLTVVADLVDEIETTTPSGLRVKPGDPVASSTLRSRVTGTAGQSRWSSSPWWMTS